jgi:transposase
MFVRAKRKGTAQYLQIVENRREGKKVIQDVVCSLGRLDLLQQSGKLDALLASGLKFSKKLLVLDACTKSIDTSTHTLKTGSVLLFERLWKQTGIQDALTRMLAHRRFGFNCERAIFVTVLHRLINPGSDRSADQWMHGYKIDGIEHLGLHHFYRAMAWLGECLNTPATPQRENNPEEKSRGKEVPPFRRRKDEIEESLFDARRDLFSDMTLVFFDTTTLYFEGEGGETLGEHGHSKDHRPDCHQLVVGMVLDNKGNPVCCEMWPGNTTDVTTLIPVAKRLKLRFGIAKVCLVADRGMISGPTIEKIEGLQWEYILGARMRRVTEVTAEVLTRPGRYRVVHGEREKQTDPSPLRVKEVFVEDRRYIVCINDEQVRKDRHDREAIIAALRDQLKHGDKSLVGNKGYRRYLKVTGTHFDIDEDAIRRDEVYDGKWVLRTNTSLPSSEVALQYKQLWMVEQIFRTMKSVLESRPIFHKTDEAIVGHVFCSFLAVVLRTELQKRIEQKGWKAEWGNIIKDVDAISEVTVDHQGSTFVIRTEASGVAGKVFQATGVALPPVLREGDIGATTLFP